MIHVCVPLYNRNEHIRKLMWNIEDIVNETEDYNVELHVYDFNSKGLLFEMEAERLNIQSHVMYDEPPFIIGKALQRLGESIPCNEIIYFCDADTHLPNDIFKRIRSKTEKGKSFYCPIVSFEKSDGSIWTPIKDHRGCGNIGIYSQDFKDSHGWLGTPFMTKTTWGGHDSHIRLRLESTLKVNREIESDQYTRYHVRDGGWYHRNTKYVWDK
jgi:hypothetical protein